jgi:hypothetical protein
MQTGVKKIVSKAKAEAPDPEPPPLTTKPVKKKDLPMPQGYSIGIEKDLNPYVFGEKVITANNFEAINKVADSLKGATTFIARIGTDGNPIIKITSNLALFNTSNNVLDMDLVKKILLLQSYAYLTAELKNGSNGLVKVETVFNIRQINESKDLRGDEILVEVVKNNNPSLVVSSIVKEGFPPIDVERKVIADGVAIQGGSHILINYDAIFGINAQLNPHFVAWAHEWLHAALGLDHSSDSKNVLYKYSDRTKDQFRDKENPNYQNGITLEQLITGMDNYAAGRVNLRNGFIGIIKKDGTVILSNPFVVKLTPPSSSLKPKVHRRPSL